MGKLLLVTLHILKVFSPGHTACVCRLCVQCNVCITERLGFNFSARVEVRPVIQPV